MGTESFVEDLIRNGSKVDRLGIELIILYGLENEITLNYFHYCENNPKATEEEKVNYGMSLVEKDIFTEE